MDSLTSTTNGSASPLPGKHVATNTDSNNVPSPLSPPYWKTHFHDETATSVENRQLRSQIQLEDHDEETSEQFQALWAKAVRIDDYIIVRGNVPGIGDYVVWNCTVDIQEGGSLRIRKRYSEFDRLRRNLVRTFPLAGAALPEMPPKSIIHKFQSKFLEKRKTGLSYFLNCVLLNPEFSGSPVLKEFLFA